MRRLWIALAILLAIAGLGRWTGLVTDRVCLQSAALLEQGEQAALGGDLDGARALTKQTDDLWHSKLSLLHVLLRHDSLDGVTDEMDQALLLLDMGLAQDYAASSRRVIAALEELMDGEMLTIGNVL